MRILLAGILAAAIAAPVQAQEGPGTTGAAVLKLTAGGRASAFSGAYSAQTGDADVLFYNPAGIADLSAAAGFSYLRYAEGVTLGSAAASLRVGRIAVGAAAVFLDAGSVSEIVPDPQYGGERGIETGRTVSAGESSLRVAAAIPMGERLRLGAAAGLLSSDLAGTGRSTPAFDVGAQLSISRGVVAASVRNLGGSLSGGGLAAAPLPAEARLGASIALGDAGAFGLRTSADLVHPLHEGGTHLVVGTEGGLLPGRAGRAGAVGRVGYATGDAGLGALRLGAGVTFAGVALDYTFQHLDYVGAVHRVGVRWTRSE